MGRSKATPSQASMIWGVLVPSPSTKRSLVIEASAMAVPAVRAGTARADLHDARAEADRGGLAGEVGELRRAVEAPGLAAPDRVGAEAFGFEGEREGALPVIGRVSMEADADAHSVLLTVVVT